MYCFTKQEALKLRASRNINKLQRDLAKEGIAMVPITYIASHNLKSSFVYNMPFVLHNDPVSYCLHFYKYTNEAVKRLVQSSEQGQL